MGCAAGQALPGAGCLTGRADGPARSALSSALELQAHVHQCGGGL